MKAGCIPFTLLFFLIVALASPAAIINVPTGQSTIQAGIDAAADGDIVLVADGTWTGEGNRDIDFLGKAITVQSEHGPEFCTIDCQGSLLDPHRGFVFQSGEGRDSVLRGFTIANGHKYTGEQYVEVIGGAIFCDESSPRILNNIIRNCFAKRGGGIHCWSGSSPLIANNLITGTSSEEFGAGIVCQVDGSAVIAFNVISDCETASVGGGIILVSVDSPSILNNTISGNRAYSGGGIRLDGCTPLIEGNAIIDNQTYFGGGGIDVGYLSAPLIRNNIISGNSGDLYAGAIYIADTTYPTIINNTITDNTSSSGGAVHSFGTNTTTIKNTIVWGNSPLQLSGEPMDITYSDIGGGYAGTGNIAADPGLVEGPLGLFCLSQTAAGQTVNSPCVDTGDPATSGYDTTRTDCVQDSGRTDMGFHYPAIFLLAGPGPGFNCPPCVRFFPPADTAEYVTEWCAYGTLHHGLNQVSCDVDGDHRLEILTGPGPGPDIGPHVRGFEVDGTPLPGLSFLAYGTNKYGVNVAAGDLDGDSMDEIITGAGPGAVFGPHVRAWDYDGSQGITSIQDVNYFAYGTPKWGVNVAAGDIDGDGFDEIITGAGPGAVYGPHVRGWNVDGGPAAAMSGVSFLAYGTNKFGVNVTCGDMDGDGMDEIITGAGPGAVFGPHVRGWNYDGFSITPLPGFSFFAWDTEPLRFGVTVFAGADLNNDGRNELVTGRGPDPDADTEVKVFTYDGTDVSQWLSLEAFPGLTHGTNVAAGRF